MTDRICVIDNCDNPARSPGQALCKMHYHRRYRHGSVDKVATGMRTGSGRRYRLITCTGHPMAQANGRGYEHRVVLYDVIGPGPHDCHWCGRSVDWLPHGHPDALQPDHLNGFGDDNDPVNLVPSCPRCNAGRAVQHRAAALRDAGWWAGHDTVARSSGRLPLVTASRHAA